MNSWTKEEDKLLQQLYTEAQSFKKWKQISDKFQALGIFKSVYECRQRYINKLDPIIKNDKWSKQQIQTLFSFYSRNGSKWQKMQSVLPQRTQGQLKNKFYSFLRSLILKSSQESKQLKNMKIDSISSKLLKRMFQGIQEFAKYKGKMSEYLRMMQYEISSQRIQQLIKKRDYEIKQIIRIIFQNGKKLKSKQRQISQHDNEYEEQTIKRLNKQKINKQKEFQQNNDDEDSSQNGCKKDINKQKYNRVENVGNKMNEQKIKQEKQDIRNEVKNEYEYRRQINMNQNGGLDNKQVINNNDWVEWNRNGYHSYLVDNNMRNIYLKVQQGENIVATYNNMHYCLMPFNGQQFFYYYY